MDVFRHEDVDGDKLTVEAHYYESGRPWVVFLADSTGSGLFREDMIRLRDWLTDAINQAGPDSIPAVVPVPLTAADVRAIAAEVVAEAMAQQEPRATISNGAEFCRIPGCMRFPGTAEHFEHDPEPQEVGHPTAPATITLADALADPTPANMEALWTPSQSFPIECGLCKAPWSDGHGQPGDPCTGAPKQLVGCECGHRWGTHKTEGCMAHDSYEVSGYCLCLLAPPAAGL